MTTKELLKIKDEIDKAKSKKDQLTGKLQSSLEKLKDEFNCESDETALYEIDSLKKQIGELESKRNKLLDNIEKVLG